MYYAGSGSGTLLTDKHVIPKILSSIGIPQHKLKMPQPDTYWHLVHTHTVFVSSCTVQDEVWP